MSVLISCEVGGAKLPPQWPALQVNRRDLSDQPEELPRLVSQVSRDANQSAQNFLPAIPDQTAAYVATQMAERLKAPLIANEYCKELIDVRRSLRHRQLFSKAIRSLSAADRQQLIESIYMPYRERLRTKLQRMLSRSAYVIHLSVQSFPLVSSPGKGKQISRADMGLLYDPSEQHEFDLVLDWIDEMYDALPMLRVRRNYPQRGTRDSITKAMRSELVGENYIGIELMVNQAWAGRPIAIRDEVIEGICGTLNSVLEVPQSAAA